VLKSVPNGQCPSGFTLSNRLQGKFLCEKNILKCPEGFETSYGNFCVKSIKRCPNGFIRNKFQRYACEPIVECPKGFKKYQNNYCIAVPERCPEGFEKKGDYCEAKCPKGFERFNQQCVKRQEDCPNGFHIHDSIETCVVNN